MIPLLIALALELCSPPACRHLSEAQARKVVTALVDAATSHDLDPALVFALAWKESRFDVGAVARTGAFGLLQTMPAYWGRRPLQLCLVDPANCAWWQSWYGGQALAHYVRRCGSVPRALTAYRTGRCGPANAEAKKVLALWRRIKVRLRKEART